MGGHAMVFYLMYIWSRKEPHVQVTFYGFGFKAWHLPFVLMAVGLLMGGAPMFDILGILVGHVYHFMADIVPEVYDFELLKCPSFLYTLMGETQTRAQDWRGGGGYRLGQ